MRGRIAGLTTLTILLVSSASAQMNNKMGDLADQLRTQLAGEPVTVQQQGAITLTSAADAMFASGGWELNPSIPVLGKIIPTLAKLQRTEIVVGGYTDNTPIGAELQGKGVSTNLALSCMRGGSVVAHLVAQGVNANLLSVQCFGATRPVATNDTAEGKAKNRRVAITLIGDGT